MPLGTGGPPWPPAALITRRVLLCTVLRLRCGREDAIFLLETPDPWRTPAEVGRKACIVNQSNIFAHASERELFMLTTQLKL